MDTRVLSTLVSLPESTVMTLNDGGPAFPPPVVQDSNGAWQESTAYGLQVGMSLRDYFAAKVMQGELAAMQDHEAGGSGLPLDVSNDSLVRLTQHYYRVADAMLVARQEVPRG